MPQRPELHRPRLPGALIARSRRDLAIRVLHASIATGSESQTALVHKYPTATVAGRSVTRVTNLHVSEVSDLSSIGHVVELA